MKKIFLALMFVLMLATAVFGQRVDITTCGEADCTPIVQSAIDTLTTETGGGEIAFLPNGTFKFDSRVTIDAPITLTSVGGIATLQLNSSQEDLFFIGDGGCNAKIKNLRFSTANGIANRPVQSAFIRVDSKVTYASGIVIEQCVFHNTVIQGSAIIVDASDHLTIQGNFLTNNKIGIWMRNYWVPDMQGPKVINNSIYLTKNSADSFGIYHTSGGGAKIIGNTIERYSVGICYNPVEGDTSNLLIEGNSIENQTGFGILLYRASGTKKFYNVVIVGNQFAILSYAISVGSQGFYRITIVGNSFSNVTTVAINLDYGDDGMISGNTIEGLNNGSYGIRVNYTANRIDIGPNHFRGLGVNQVNHSVGGHTFSW